MKLARSVRSDQPSADSLGSGGEVGSREAGPLLHPPSLPSTRKINCLQNERRTGAMARHANRSSSIKIVCKEELARTKSHAHDIQRGHEHGLGHNKSENCYEIIQDYSVEHIPAETVIEDGVDDKKDPLNSVMPRDAPRILQKRVLSSAFLKDRIVDPAIERQTIEHSMERQNLIIQENQRLTIEEQLELLHSGQFIHSGGETEESIGIEDEEEEDLELVDQIMGPQVIIMEDECIQITIENEEECEDTCLFPAWYQRLSSILTGFLDTRNMVDVLLRGEDGESVAAHQLILGHASPLLAQILSEVRLDCPEDTPIVIIPNAKTSLIRELIYSVYTGNIPGETETRSDVWDLAEVLGLKLGSFTKHGRELKLKDTASIVPFKQQNSPFLPNRPHQVTHSDQPLLLGHQPNLNVHHQLSRQVHEQNILNQQHALNRQQLSHLNFSPQHEPLTEGDKVNEDSLIGEEEEEVEGMEGKVEEEEEENSFLHNHQMDIQEEIIHEAQVVSSEDIGCISMESDVATGDIPVSVEEDGDGVSPQTAVETDETKPNLEICGTVEKPRLPVRQSTQTHKVLEDQRVQVVQTMEGEILILTCHNPNLNLSVAPEESVIQSKRNKEHIRELQSKVCGLCQKSALSHRVPVENRNVYVCCQEKCENSVMNTVRAFLQHVQKHKHPSEGSDSTGIKYEPADKPCPLCLKPRIEHKNRDVTYQDKGNHKGNLYKCCHCSASRLTAKKFFTHLENHVAKKHVCALCKKGYSYRHLLEEHEWKMHGEGQFMWIPCPYEDCEYKARYKQTLHTHINEHHRGVVRKHSDNNTKVTCPNCKKVLKKWYFRLHHSKTCLPGNAVYKCGICLKEGFITRTTLQNHMRLKHSEDRPYSCEYCYSKYATAMSLSSHRSRKHGLNSKGEEVPKKMYSCSICSKLLTSSIKLKNHIEVIHEGRRDFNCKFCGKSFTSKSNLQIHEGSQHTGILPYNCDKCDKSFGRKQQYQQHWRQTHADPEAASADVPPHSQYPSTRNQGSISESGLVQKVEYSGTQVISEDGLEDGHFYVVDDMDAVHGVQVGDVIIPMELVKEVELVQEVGSTLEINLPVHQKPERNNTIQIIQAKSN